VIPKTRFRILIWDEKVYLSLDSVNGAPSKVDRTIEVRRPVTRATLDQARDTLVAAIVADIDAKHEDEKERKASSQETDPELHREIAAALGIDRKASLLTRAKGTVERLMILFLQLLFGFGSISLAYKGVEASQENLPQPVHIFVLTLYFFVLAFGIWTIGTEKRRAAMSGWIQEMTGPRGWLLYPGLLLVTSAAVFASLTLMLYDKKWLEITPGSSSSVSIGSLMDFYMWHFINLVPLLRIPEVLNWKKPLLYEQSRVGFLILAFQAFVVIPTISAVRYYWKHRDEWDQRQTDYVYGATSPAATPTPARD